jgi:hypothetical protein
MKCDTTGLTADYNSRSSKMLKLLCRSCVNTAYSKLTQNMDIFPCVSMLCFSVQTEVLLFSRT